MQLKNGHEVFVFICFNEDIKEYDGIAIIRSQEIEQYRYWEENEIAEIKNNNYMDFVDTLQIENLNTFYDCLIWLQQKTLIAIYIKDDNESYYIGKIETLDKKQMTLKLINEESKWLNSINIIIETFA